MASKGNETIGQRLKACRKQMGMTQKEMFSAIGISQDHLCKFENDKLVMSYDILKRLYLQGWDINYIITGSRIEWMNHFGVSSVVEHADKDKEYKYFRFLLYYMECQVGDGALLQDNHLYHEFLTLSQMQTLEDQKFKSIRKAHNISQEDMAEILNMNTKTYAKLEHGEKEPDAGVLLRLYEKGYCWPSFFFNVRRHMYGIAEFLLFSMDGKKGVRGQQVLDYAKKLLELL
ncbi:MAG: helix-turn-helix transcriptional regulator [Eubacteriales bacterium]|nr:helix-turn-helix transcriptional regulator [Eubacteriales bacterium]